MKPLTLTLSNFGPFLNETIDFKQVFENQLFLISGKTGSGKTMIFDGIVYALFGVASTKSRTESDLRSHFAEAKEPMSVTFEFEINQRQFKIFRQGSYIKEGNKTKTPGKLTVYEFDGEVFDLRESKIHEGNLFIQQLLGVNAEQFRQLFILPQGEFKRFLVSSSSDKQSILRTLFNSLRFEQIQDILADEVKNEKQLIEQRYNKIAMVWEEIEDFEIEDLQALKQIESIQIQKLVDAIPIFQKYGSEQLLATTKLKQAEKCQTEKLHKALVANNELEKQLNDLADYTQRFELLRQEQENIDKLKHKITQLNEIRTLNTLVQQRESQIAKLNDFNNAITSKGKDIESIQEQQKQLQEQMQILIKSEHAINQYKEYIDKCHIIYQKIESHRKAMAENDNVKKQLSETQQKIKQYNEKQTKLKKQKAENDIDYNKIVELTDELAHINKLIDKTKETLSNNQKFKELKNEYIEDKKQLKMIEKEFEHVSNHINKLTAKNLDLNDKESFINELQSALSIGEICPVCGNEIQSLEKHIDFENIKLQKHQLDTLEKEKLSLTEQKIKLETEMSHAQDKMKEIKVDEEPLDLESLQVQYNEKELEKASFKEKYAMTKQIETQINEYKKDIHQMELQYKDLSHQRNQNEQRIGEFISTTQTKDIDTFIQQFESYKKQIEIFENSKEQLTNEIITANQQKQLESNNLINIQNQKHIAENEYQSVDKDIQTEMRRYAIKDEKALFKILEDMHLKSDYEQQVEAYSKKYAALEHEIGRLKSLTHDKVLQDTKQLENSYQVQSEKLDKVIEQENTLKYQLKKNDQKFDVLYENINYLTKELKSQQEIFNLAEILSGKNSQKLTLETYVLIYYLERIIAQANLRLATMSGQRYHLQRRKSLSHGYSGLEIDVFDFHSNKSRHISSLSGGETFQASLALALGLSEVVQEESGGITLESMFIDEGFGTLDQETLDTALDTLVNLKSSGRMVGIISHVTELKQRIPLILEVTSKQFQSATQFKFN